MSNNKQSSVEWLVEQIKKDINLRLRGFDIDKALNQAKAMHEEEMVDFANDLLAQNDNTYIAMPDKAEKYYKETYGGNNEQQ